MNQQTHHLMNLQNCTSQRVLSRVRDLYEVVNPVIGDEGKTSSYFHQFNPQGVTFLYLGENLQVTGHTWPERGTMALDALTSDPNEGLRIVNGISEVLGFTTSSLLDPNKSDLSTPYEFGTQTTGYFTGVRDRWIEDDTERLNTMREIAHTAGFTVVGEMLYNGKDSSATALVLAESHFILRQRKNGTLWADIFTCGDEGSSIQGMNNLKKRISTSNSEIRFYNR